MTPNYRYRARYTSNYDGDTVRLDIDLGFFIWNKNQAFRLLGVDCPELRGDTLAAGKLSRDFVANVLMTADEIIVESVKDSKEKYGRWLGTIYYRQGSNEFVNLNQELVERNYAIKAEY